MPQKFILFLFLIPFFTLLFVLIITIISRSQRRIKKRVVGLTLKDHLNTPSQTSDEEGSLNKRPLTKLMKKATPFVKGIKLSDASALKLLHAGLQLSPHEFLIIRIGVGIGVVLFTRLFGLPLVFAIIGGFIGFFLPNFVINRRIKKRLELCGDQLAEGLGTMANAMRAGFSFMQALQLVSKEVGDPLGRELDRVLRDIHLGESFEEAFESLTKRVPLKELELVVNALIVQRKNGGNLAELLETMQETIHGRVRIKEELKTLTAQGKMSMWIITCLPVGLAMYLKLADAQYFDPMLHAPLGILMLSVSGALIVLGWILIRKIINVEV